MLISYIQNKIADSNNKKSSYQHSSKFSYHHSSDKTSTSISAHYKSLRNPLISGTLLLAAAGLIARVIGFYYKIFLSRAIGAESLGLYQLTAPVLSLGMSLTSSGIQTALSRYVAQEHRTGRQSLRYFLAALCLSLFLCAIFGIFVHLNANWIAVDWLGDARCEALLSVSALCLFPACAHACINGYYYGLKESVVPSASQLVEQVVRVGAMYAFYSAALANGEKIGALAAAWSMTISECSGLLVSGVCMYLKHRISDTSQVLLDKPSYTASAQHQSMKMLHHKSGISKLMSPNTQKRHFHNRNSSTESVQVHTSISFRRSLILIAGLAFPLTFNRVVMNIFSSIENVLIPQSLIRSGLSSADALSLYGILTGMVLSTLMFPSVLTGSLSTLLLPTISGAHAAKDQARIAHLSKKAILCGLLFGFLFTGIFLLTGDFIGTALFDSTLAGVYIRRLCFICPFTYVSSLIGSILHGLGQPKIVLFVNLLSCLMRIVFILLLVPGCGVDAYLWSMLLSQVFCAAGSMISLRSVYMQLFT